MNTSSNASRIRVMAGLLAICLVAPAALAQADRAQDSQRRSQDRQPSLQQQQAQPQRQSQPGLADPSAEQLTPQAFTKKAALGSLKEIHLAQVALKKTESSEVRQFATRMIEDHSRMSQELKLIADSKGYQLPPTNAFDRALRGETGRQLVSGAVAPGDPTPNTDATLRDRELQKGADDLDASRLPVAGRTEHDAEEEHMEAVHRLESLSGEEFSKAYAAQMVKDHEKTVALFEKASQNLTDQELRQLAEKTLPKLREHLQMAQRLDQGSASRPGTDRSGSLNNDALRNPQRPGQQPGNR